MKRFCLLLCCLLTASCLLPTAYSVASLTDCIDATCRITAADGSRGTGCCFERSGGHVYVLTAAHVVGPSETVACEFWRDGHRSERLPGRVIRRIEHNGCDAAIVALKESQFAGLPPKVVPMAPRDYVVRPGETIVSVGCAKGAWSTGWKGHAVGYSGSDLYFTPPPANGRSGSALLNAEGTMIVGLLTARTGDDRQGIATSLQALYKGLGKEVSTNEQCGPNGCPSQQAPPYRALPYRQQHDWEHRQLKPVWPTLPPPVQPTPPIDLSETNQRLEHIAILLENSLAARLAPRSPDETAQAAQKENEQLKATVDELSGEQRSLKQQFEARLAKVKEELGEDASKRDIARAYVKDLAAEKLAGGGGFTIGKLLGGALGLSAPLALAIALAGFFVSRRIGSKIQAGEPLLIERLVDRMDQKIDAIRDKVEKR